MKASQFKSLLKEVFREVLKEELPLLMENRDIPIINRNNIPDFKHTPKPPTKQIPSGNPLIDLLNETKTGMTGDDWQNIGNFNSNNMNNFSPNIHGNESKVGTVGDMLNTSTKTSHLEQIQIDVVPDYSKLMGTMKEQGKI